MVKACTIATFEMSDQNATAALEVLDRWAFLVPWGVFWASGDDASALGVVLNQQGAPSWTASLWVTSLVMLLLTRLWASQEWTLTRSWSCPGPRQAW